MTSIVGNFNSENCRAMPDRSCHYLPLRVGTNSQGEPVAKMICGNCGRVMPGGESFVKSSQSSSSD